MSHGQAPRLCHNSRVWRRLSIGPGPQSGVGSWLLHLFSFVHTTFVACAVRAAPPREIRQTFECYISHYSLASVFRVPLPRSGLRVAVPPAAAPAHSLVPVDLRFDSAPSHRSLQCWYTLSDTGVCARNASRATRSRQSCAAAESSARQSACRVSSCCSSAASVACVLLETRLA